MTHHIARLLLTPHKFYNLWGTPRNSNSRLARYVPQKSYDFRGTPKRKFRVISLGCYNCVYLYIDFFSISKSRWRHKLRSSAHLTMTHHIARLLITPQIIQSAGNPDLIPTNFTICRGPEKLEFTFGADK